MSQSINKSLDITQLKIDRKSPTNTFWRPAHITTIAILVLISISVFHLATLIFLPANNAIDNNIQLVNTRQNSNIQSSVKPIANTLVKKTKNIALTSIKLNKVDSKANSKTKSSILDASGHIVARRIATVSSQITGKLEQLNIEEGQRVTKSQVLAQLDNKQAKITHQLALAKLAANQASFDELALLSQQQTQHVNRNITLAKQQLISAQFLEDSQFKNNQLAIQLNNKQALLNVAKQHVALAKYQLAQHEIRAPFNGVVISKNAQVGELISAGSSGGGFIRTGVGTIVDMSSLEIEVEVGESYINRVFAGQKVIAKLDAYPQWDINSEVVAVIPTANRQKASIRVRVKFFENDPRILPDMGVKVSFFNQPISSNQAPMQTKLAAL